MIDYIELKGVDYGFARDFKHVSEIRLSFNRLTESVFGFSLENWYKDGFWGDYYIPYSLLDKDQVVSNVSINKLEFDIAGERKTGIQIGTVMTDEKYRNRGLNKFLMEKVMEDWKGKTDFIYLFANNTALDFYPKFNFRTLAEYQLSRKIITHSKSSKWDKLNMEHPADVTLLQERIKESVPVAKIAMRNNISLIMFYCCSYQKDNIFYIQELDVIVIACFSGDTLYLDDIFSTNPIAVNEVINSLSDKKIERVILGFTPLDESGFDKHLWQSPDTLFMQKDEVGFFLEKQWMFPVLSHA